MEWRKAGELSYELYDQEQRVATMAMNKPGESKCEIDGHNYIISSSGFWNTETTLKSEEGEILGKVSLEKWYASRYVLEFSGVKYNLEVRNNPLCEFAISDSDSEVLTYGLKHDSNQNRLAICLKERNKQPLLIHALIWHLFEPIARENFADNLWWLAM